MNGTLNGLMIPRIYYNTLCNSDALHITSELSLSNELLVLINSALIESA